MSVRIFISAVSDEFRDYRDQLRSDLARHNVEVKVQEDFKDAGGVTLDKLDLYITNCDAVVHLVGDMTGADAKPASTAAILRKYPDIPEKIPPLKEPLAKGEGISYTQWEAWLAIYHGKALLIAEADTAAPRGSNYAPTDASRAAQRAHLERLKQVERFPGFTFASLDHLASHIAYTTILDLLAEDRAKEMPREGRGIPYAAIIGTLLLLLLTPLVADHLTRMFGLAFGATATLVGGIGGFALALMYWRYVEILGVGAAPSRSAERQAYDALRATIAAGGWPVWLYARWLTKFLDAVDRFFHDAGKAGRTLFPNAFGLRAPAPLWTAPAFDRCLLLALIYPIATIFIIWAVSGQAGPAEEALLLQSTRSGWQRGIISAVVAFLIFTSWRGTRPKGMNSFGWLVVAVAMAVNLVVNFDFASAAALAVAVAVAVAVFLAFAVQANDDADVLTPGAGATAITLAVGITGALCVAASNSLIEALLFCYLIGFMVAVWVALAVRQINWIAMKRGRQGMFLGLFLIGMILICLVAAKFLSPLKGWDIAGPFLLFLGLLTLINAPFDWASLGLTRALLRRGLELGGWWPFVLALLDAVLAGVIIAALALTMVVGVQAFDYLASRGDGEPVLPLKRLFDGLASHPEWPEYWWLYALLLSTMIPSLFNLMIGGTALMRTVPGLPSLLLKRIPAIGGVLAFDRAWLALVLTLQVAIGVVLGVVLQAALAIGLIRYVMPSFGLGLLDLARTVADWNLPAKVGAFF